MAETAPYLDRERLLAMISPREALSAVQDFFAGHGRSEVEVPPRIHLPVPGVNTVGLYMPAATGSYIGVKIVHLMPDRRLAVEAEIFFYEAVSGRLLYWGDGKPLTALRTAAVSVAATLRLRPTITNLLVYGTGVQAAAHLEAFATAYPGLGENIWVAARSPESFRRLLQIIPQVLNGRVQRLEESAAAVAKILGQVDCVVATTPAPRPLFDWRALRPGCHVVGIGSATPAMNELPTEAFTESLVWVDTTAALTEAGDCHAALAAGWREDQVQGDLFDLLGSASLVDTQPLDSQPLENSTDKSVGNSTLFKSVGHAAQDLALFIRIWELLNR